MAKPGDGTGQPQGDKTAGVSVTELEQLLNQSRSMKQRFEPSWFLGLSYYSGDQWVYWNRGRLDKPKLAAWRPKVVDNRIMPAVNTRIARLTKHRPTWVSAPRTQDEEDVSQALLAEQVVEAKWDDLFMWQHLQKALHWANVCSAGFWKIYWDKGSGKARDALIGPDNKPVLDEDGKPLFTDLFGGSVPPELLQFGVKVKTIAQGDVCIETRSPFEVFPDPLAQTLDECEWVIEETVKSREWVKARFGVDVKPDADAAAGVTESRFISGQTATPSPGGYKGVKVKEFWSKPNSKYPAGKRVIWAGKQILAQGNNPYGDLPYVMFRGEHVPGRFWPSSITEQLREPQTELNKVKSQIAENAARIGNPSLLKNRLANVNYFGVPGEEILFDGTVPDAVPKFLQPPEMPVYVREQIDRIEGSIREISGQTEVMGGSVPTGVTAASAINLLLESGDTRLSQAITDMEAALSRAGTLVLRIVAQYYTDDRIVRLAGEDGDWDIRTFRGDELGDEPQVDVQAGSMFPRSKAAKQASMQDLLNLALQYQLPLKARSLRKYFRDFEAGAGLERMFDDLSTDEAQITREHRRLYEGQTFPVNTYDNHQAHIDGHTDEQKTARYERNPDVHRAYELHILMHRIQLMQEMGTPPPGLPAPPTAPDDMGAVAPDPASPGALLGQQGHPFVGPRGPTMESGKSRLPDQQFLANHSRNQ